MRMPEKRPPRPRDTNQLAKRVVYVATGLESDAPRVEISALARAASLTPERRREIGQKAAAARWGRTAAT